MYIQHNQRLQDHHFKMEKLNLAPISLDDIDVANDLITRENDDLVNEGKELI